MASIVAISSGKQNKRSPPVSSKAVIRYDGAHSLEPARKKLTTLETQRVMAVWDEAIKRAQILATLPSLIDNLADFAIVLGRELVSLLEQHTPLHTEYALLSAKMDIILERAKPAKTTAELISEEDFWTRPRSSVSTKSSVTSVVVTESLEELRPQKAEILRKMLELQPKLQFSTRCILRAFRSNPAAVTAVIGGGGVPVSDRLERTEDSKPLVEQMNHMRDIMMLRLMTTPAEKAERLAYLRDVSERERANTAVIEKLALELQNGVKDKDMEVKKKNDVIRRLQTDIHHIEKFSEENIKRIKSEAEKQQAADVKNSDGKKQKLAQELAQFKNQLANIVNEHRESEANLRRRKWKLDTEVENWIQKYDNDMGDRQTEFEEVDAGYNEERKQLVELEERFKTLEEEYNQIQEERRIAREKKEAQEREMRFMIMAATTIQSFWRSYKVRKLLRGKKKGKGKKGK